MSAPAAMRWVEELAPDHRWLAALGGDASGGVYAAGRGLYRLDGGAWTLIPGSDSRAWRGLSVDPAGAWVVGASGMASRLDHGQLVERAIAGAGYDILAIVGDGSGAWATAAGAELWRWDGSAWTSTVPPEFGGQTLGALYLAPDGTLFVKSHPKASSQGSSVSRGNGATWTRDDIGLKGHIEALAGTSSSDVWAVGYTVKLFGKGGQAHHWDGKAWTSTPLPVDQPLHALYARAPDDVWAGGERGTLLRWDGKAWTQVPTGLKWGITAILAPAGQPLRVIENAARILRWEDL